MHSHSRMIQSNVYGKSSQSWIGCIRMVLVESHVIESQYLGIIKVLNNRKREKEGERAWESGRRCYELKLQILWQYSQDHSPSFSSSSSESSCSNHHSPLLWFIWLWFWFWFWGSPYSMTMIHLILVDMVDQASGLLARNHGVLEINVGSMHVPGSKDLLPHPLHDHEPHLLPRAPHCSSVTSFFIHPCLLLLCLLHELYLGGWDVAEAMEHYIHGMAT